jgi:dTDP-glucose 4,6-dehydratase/UDP-glucuronate decarboxylase
VIHDDLEQVLQRAEPALRRLAGKTVVVAGGAGFLPSYLVDALASANDRLLEDPCRVISIDNLATGVAGRLEHLRGRDDVALVEQDLVQGLSLDERVDYIVHAASIASPSWYRRYPLETIDVNVVGTRRLLELAREQDIAGFLYLSSSEIYGDPPPERVPTTEDYWGHVSSTGPRACYDESKRLAEALCMTYFRLHGTPVKLVRPFNVYGPRLRLDDGRVVPDLIADALNGRPITLYSNGRATRSFCYISDFVTASLLLLVADVAGEAYNVGNDTETSIRELAEAIDRASGRGLGVRFQTSGDPDYLTDNPNRRSPDLGKVKATVDWSPVVGLDEGLARTYRHYLERDER